MSEPAENETDRPQYKRVLLKVSGESLAGDQDSGISIPTVRSLADEIREVVEGGCILSIVVGGGNIFRGLNAAAMGMDRTTGDYMGMLATVMNALALQEALEKIGVPTRVLSALEIREVAEPYIRRRAMRHLEKGRVVIFAAGTGNPIFTTDTAASLRAIEVGADVIMKATRVDGIYDDDPEKNPDAKLYTNLTYHKVLSDRLRVMDAAAIALCMDHSLPLLVFNVGARGNILRAVRGERIGTLVEAEAT